LAWLEGVKVREDLCDRLIDEAEQLCRTLGADLYEVMKKAPQVVEKWKAHYVLAHEVWRHAQSREELTGFLRSGPDPTPGEVEGVITLMRTVPYILRRSLQTAASTLPSPPGGRPKGLTQQQEKEVCAQIGWLYGQGVEVRDAQKRMALRYGKSLRTIQRAWQRRAQWKTETTE
jgi:hypothetical protein